ncbi:hypothetical protein ACF0H5_018261 [Mactra antiquata]
MILSQWIPVLFNCYIKFYFIFVDKDCKDSIDENDLLLGTKKKNMKSGPTVDKSKGKDVKKEVQSPDRNDAKKSKSKTKRADPAVVETPKIDSVPESPGIRSSRRTRNVSTPNWADILSGRKSFKKDGGVFVVKKEPESDDGEDSGPGFATPKLKKQKVMKKDTRSRKSLGPDVNIVADKGTHKEPETKGNGPQKVTLVGSKKIPADKDVEEIGGITNKSSPRKTGPSKASKSKSPANKNETQDDVNDENIDGNNDDVNDDVGMETEYHSPESSYKSGFRMTYKFACSECDRKFCVGYLLEEHMKNSHGKTVDGIDAEDDDIEELDGDDDDDYAVEVKECETQVDSDVSDLDNDIKEITVGKVETENQSLLETDEKPTCQTCGQIFLSVANLRRHSLLHTNKMYECPFCAKIMKRKDYVNTHVRKVHKEINIDKNPINFDNYTHVIPAEDVHKEDDIKVLPKVEAGKGKKICPECNKLFDTSEELEEHLILTHDKDLKNAVFTCQGCKKQFKTLVSYQVHKLSHRKKDHVCQHCGKTFVNNSQLQVHRRRDHQLQIGTLYYFGYVNNDDKICCEICSKDFENMMEYHEHRPVHLAYNFLCKKCGNGFTEESELQKHTDSDCSYLNLHLPCGVCNMKFSMYDTRRKHIIASHKKTTEFYCHHCGKCCNTIDELGDHFNTHKDDRIFKCEICEKMFLEKRNLVDHRELHRSSKDWQCHICKKGYLSSKSLQRHIKLHLSKTFKRCKHCNASFPSVEELNTHIVEAHSDQIDETDIKCKICSRTFLDHARLLKHMQIHDGKNTYTCDVCNNEYDANFLPQWKHMKKEHPVEYEATAKKTYYCDICDFSSPHKQRLERHNETHNESKNFECQYCGRRYQTTSSLMTHMIVHRGKVKKGAKPQPVCTWPNCSKQFIKYSLYKRHLISHIFRVKMGKDLCDCGNCQHSSLLAGQSYFVEDEVEYTHVGYVDEDGNPLVATKLDPPPADARNKSVINLQVLANEGEKGYDTMEVLQEAIAKIEDIENKTQPELVEKVGENITPGETVNRANEEVDESAPGVIPRDVNMAEQESQNVANSNITTEFTPMESEDGLPTACQNAAVTTTMDAGTQSIDQPLEGENNVVSQVEVLVDSIYECGVCDLMYPHKCQVLSHLESQHPKQSFPQCPTCGKIIIDKKNLGDHMVIHEDSKKFQCEVCSKSFRTKQCLKQHSYIHATQKPYTCNFCGHGFTQKGFYLEHIRRHTGIKPFKCFVCQKAFVSKNLLRIHMFSHANSKPYKCDVCPKSFSENYLLTAHMRTHNDDRPFGCTECDKSFYVKPKLLRHLNAVHGIAKELLTNFVPTRVGDGIGYRNRNKLPKYDADKDPDATVVYINSEGHIVRQGTENRGRTEQGTVTLNRPIKIKPSSTFTSITAQSIASSDKDMDEDIQSFEVVTKRDEHGSVQVNPVMQGEVYSTDGERIELNGQNYTLVTDDAEGGEGHITLITQTTFDGDEVEGHTDQGQGEIQVITQEVTEGEVTQGNDDLRVISQADLTQNMEDGEKFSINIGEDGTVDMADFDKIEALRNIYGDQQIVIVVESQQQEG